MLLKDIIKQINRLISNNSSYNLNFEKLEFYIDGAVDHINETLKTDFKTPREYYEANSVDEIISYHENFIGVLTTPPEASSVFPEGSIYFLLSKEEGVTSGYYVKHESGDFSLVEDLSDLIKYISFTNTNIFSYVDKYNYTQIPDKYIRSILVYYAAALYLEEEDELENQYAIYKSKADESLAQWQQLDFSVFDITESNRRFI
jgi:hypothetical protein